MIEIIKKFIPWRRVFNRRVDKQKKSAMIGCLLKSHDLGYMFLPKTASSSLKRLIYEIEMGEPFPEDGLPGRPNFHSHQWVVRSRLGDISKAGRRMIVIRDPVKRALSAYADKVQKKKLISKNNLQKKRPELIGKLPAYNPSLSVFLEFFEDYLRIQTIHHHIRPFNELLNGHDLTFFTDIFKFEYLNLAHNAIVQITSHQGELQHTNNTNSTATLADLSESELDFLLDYYATDYELLKGYYSPKDLKNEWRRLHNPPASSSEIPA